MRAWWMVMALLGPPAAMAQDGPVASEDAEDRARELYENGKRLYDEGAYEAAVAAWQASYDLSGNPALLFNLASAQERLGRLDAAIDSLNRYRAFAPAEEGESLERRLRSLERRAALAQEEAPTPTTPATLPTTPATAPSRTQAAVEPVPARRGASGLTVAGGVLTGLGGGGLIAGGILQGLTQARRDDALASCTTAGDGVTCLSAASPLVDEAQATATGRTAAFVSGGALLASGAALLIVDAVTDRPTRVGVAALPTAGGAVASLTVAF